MFPITEQTYKKPYEIIKIDKNTGKINTPTLLLMNRSGHIIGRISRYDNWQISLVGNGIDEITFDVHKYTDGITCPVWNDLEDLKIVEVDGFGRYEISVNYTDNTETVKSVHGFSLETELAQISLYEFHVNDEEAADMEITEHSRDNYDSEGNFIPTTFYREISDNDSEETAEYNRKHSLLHRVLADKAPHWSIGYVTPYIALGEDVQPEESSKFQRTYTVDGDSIYDFLTGTVAEESNVIFVFDTIHRKINCYSLCDCIDQESGELMTYKEEPVTGIGEDTAVFVSKTKLANEITISSNKDNVKNCFRIEGGDDVITDMVRAVNMSGSNYIYQFAGFQYDDMSEDLKNKITAYQEMMSSKKTQDMYYGSDSEDIEDFLNGKYLLEVESEMDAAYILGLCRDNRIYTGTVDADDPMSARYWRVTGEDGAKRLYPLPIIINQQCRKSGDVLSSLGIYPRLCRAYDDLAYYESSMMPGTSKTAKPGKAQEQYDKVFSKLNKSIVAVSSLDSYSKDNYIGVTNNIQAYAQIFLDSRFDLEIIDGTTTYACTKNAATGRTETGTWTGRIRIRQHTDETNVFSSASPIEITVNDDEQEFAKQKVYKALSKSSMMDIDFTVAGMNKNDMLNYFNRYSLNRLQAFYQGYDSCLSILMNLGQATVSKTAPNARNDLYDAYKQRFDIVESIKEERQEQVDEINSRISDLLEEQKYFKYGGEYKGKHYDPHDFKTYLADDDLYREFCSYRREDAYTNSNYISDGLSTTECLEKAKELVEAATKEAKKACMLQRTVSTSLNNLFALPEFDKLYDKFALYNYIRVKTDDEILKLRLIGIDFSGDSAENIEVTFSEQIESVDGRIDDLKSIIQQASSMATSYPSTALQAKQGSDAKNEITDMYTNGLNAAKTMLTNNDNNEVTVTESGIICRRMDDEGFYGHKQIRITGNIMAFTDDSWESVRMAIGETTFIDPTDPETDPEKKRKITAYGLLAPAIVGKFIVGESAYIGDENGYVQITKDGIEISNGVIKSKDYTNDGKGNETGSIIDLRNGSFSFADGGLKFEEDKKSKEKKLILTGDMFLKNGLHMWYDDKYGMGEGSKFYKCFSAEMNSEFPVINANLDMQLKNVWIYGTIYNTEGGIVESSDKDLKYDIQELDKRESSQFIYSLKPSKYKYNNGTSGRFHHGFIAQEVKESLGKEDNAVYVEQKDGTKGLRYEEFIADLVATVQEQNEQLHKQNERIRVLEEKLDTLK